MNREETMMYGIRQAGSELAHYGVLGMKWGVRKNPNRAVSKSLKKLRKYEAKADKARAAGVNTRLKSAKYQMKADQLNMKADRTVSSGKAAKLQKKARKANAKYLSMNYAAAKQDKKALKQMEKGKKWAGKMNKYLSGTKYTDVSKEDIAYARKWLVTALDKD